MTAHEFKLGELYSGPGGLAFGILNARSDDGSQTVKHIWASDYDLDSCETYRLNICPQDPGSVINIDVNELDITSLQSIDAFAYGFPCNSFSNAGKHLGREDTKFGQLYWHGVEVLKLFRPQWFIAENVSGILSAGSDDFKVILDDLRECGYKLNVHHYLSELYGIPQTRHRVIIVGIRNDLPYVFRVPDPQMFLGADITAKTALMNIPKNAPNNEIIPLRDKTLERLSLIKPGQNIWQAQENGQIPEELMIKDKVPISTIYRKLDPEKPSYTITSNGGGGTHGYHWENRSLTNRERARLQTFPDNYTFVGKYTSVRKQIGMAVPCRLAQIVASAILNSFAEIEYPSIPANILDDTNNY